MNNTPFRRFSRRLRHNNSGMLGLVITTSYLIVAIFAAQLATFSPLEQHAIDRLQPPNRTYLLGTDEFGRDILSRLMYGATNSLRIALISVSASFVIGTLLGVISGYFGGWADNITMRMADLLFAFPAILLALSIAVALGPGTRNTILAISVVYLPIFARVARGSVLIIKRMDYVEASRSLGAGHPLIISAHILPNSIAPSIVQFSLALSWAILTEAALSFLGLGTLPPNPSWGSMLSESRTLMEIAPWMAISPGMAIMFAVLGFNLFGDGLRDVLDPRMHTGMQA
jgi:peptide/nickel transport system permease protein